MKTFGQILGSGVPVLLDGGMGSMLEVKGLDLSGGLHNLAHPEVIEEIHREYLAAGSDCLLTNTFSLNELYLRKKGVDVDLEALNRAGVKIARKAAEGRCYVLGDIGPTGDLLAPLGGGSEEEFVACYRQQAEVLAEAGVDGFIVETFFDLNEALTALKACKLVSNLPVIVSLSFSSLVRGGVTLMGHTAAQCAQRVKAAGGDAVGCNCGDLAPAELATVVASLAAGELPVSVEPNAGKPVSQPDGRVTYDMGPVEYAQGMAQCLEAGAQILGGCCGTTPDHIRLLKELI